MKEAIDRLPRGTRRLAAEAFLALAVSFVILGEAQGVHGLVLAALGMLVASSLLVVVQAPIGSVPLGYALVIALAELADVSTYFVVVGLALLVTVPVLVARYGHDDGLRRLMRWSLASAACGGAAVAMRLLVVSSRPDMALLRVSAAGAVFLGVDLVLRTLFPTPTAPPMRFGDAWPVHISLLCAAGLLTVAYQHDPWMAALALIPLVLVKFAYDRYAAAKDAYRQTIKALSIVPEVAGVTPLGHGERSAAYAVALARQLGLSNDSVERLATAARLHHIGYVTLDDPEDARHHDNRILLAQLGGAILRETEFLADVGELVESVHGGGVESREAAVLQIATGFDHLVLEDPARAIGALQLINFRQRDPYGAAAALVLRRILDEDPEVVERAIASGAPLTEAAAASEVSRG